LRALFSLEGVVGALPMLDGLVPLESFEFLLVEEVFGLLSMPFDAVTWHTTLDAALTWSCVIARQMGLLAVYASSVGLFLLHHWFGDTGGVGNVGALALDGGGGHCCRHGWVGVSRGDDCLQRGGWEDVCRRGREGW
jgi:hypothetical protein